MTGCRPALFQRYFFARQFDAYFYPEYESIASGSIIPGLLTCSKSLKPSLRWGSQGSGISGKGLPLSASRDPDSGGAISTFNMVSLRCGLPKHLMEIESKHSYF